MSLTITKHQQIDKIFNYINDIIPKDVMLSCPDWAEQNRYLDKKTSSTIGGFNFDNAPYAREICDCFSKNSPIREVACMKAAQVGFTTSVIENAIGYTIDADPAPCMLVLPSDALCKEYKETRLDNLIDNSNLRDKIFAETENKKSKKTGDTSTMLQFSNGFIKLASANKPAALRSNSIRKLFLDELDAYPKKLKKEGKPVAIAKKRTNSFSKNKKIFYNSTPLLAHSSEIYPLYKQGDCRKYLVPCPICGEMQELVFYEKDGGLYPDDLAIKKDGAISKPFGLMFDYAACKDGDYSSIAYRCKHCGKEFKEYHKQSIELKGEWVSTQKSKIPFYRSYHISALYSQTYQWWEIVRDFITAGTNPEELQTFYNLDLGLPFEESTDGVDLADVYRLVDKKLYNNQVPKEALFMTCCADVQRDRIECEIKAWGDRFRCWGIDYRVFEGNTSDIEDECWQQFAAIKDEVFTHNKQVDLMLVDSGDGELTDVVYSFCDLYGDGMIYPLKGLATTTRTREKYKVVDLKDYDSLSLIEVYVDKYKNTLTRYLTQEPKENGYPDGWYSFAAGYPQKFFEQLTNEKKVKAETKGGLTTVKWVKKGRNEAFDINVYNLCAADMVIFNTSVLFLNLDAANPRAVFEYLKAVQKQQR